jgi:two-component system nitrogen regulation sensor histidine kinase NtrY
VLRPESVSELVKDALFLQQQAWPQLTFEHELPAERPFELLCDGSKVTQALTNLLQNAAQAVAESHREGGGRVVARARREAGDIVIEIEDDGPGFPADRERLFEPYVTTRSRGTGLGLAIVRKIMEEHAGTVALLAGSLGGGLVRLTFPVRAG